MPYSLQEVKFWLALYKLKKKVNENGGHLGEVTKIKGRGGFISTLPVKHWRGKGHMFPSRPSVRPSLEPGAGRALYCFSMLVSPSQFSILILFYDLTIIVHATTVCGFYMTNDYQCDACSRLKSPGNSCQECDGAPERSFGALPF